MGSGNHAVALGPCCIIVMYLLQSSNSHISTLDLSLSAEPLESELCCWVYGMCRGSSCALDLSNRKSLTNCSPARE